MVKDMVCGMGVEEDDPRTLYMGFRDRTYFFCSAECLLLFAKTPQEYINQRIKKRAIARDFVCDMEVDMNNAPFMETYGGKVYYFCSNACRLDFLSSPERFIEKS